MARNTMKRLSDLNWIGHGQRLTRLTLLNISFSWFMCALFGVAEYVTSPVLFKACFIPVPSSFCLVLILIIGSIYGVIVGCTAIQHAQRQIIGTVFYSRAATRDYHVRMPTGLLLGLVCFTLAFFIAQQYDSISQYPWPLLRLLLWHWIPLALLMSTVSGIELYLWIVRYEEMHQNPVLVEAHSMPLKEHTEG